MASYLERPATGALETDPFIAKSVENPSGPKHVTAPGLAGVETATIQKLALDKAYYDYYVEDVLQQVRATNTGVVITGPGTYRVKKSATNAAVGIELSTNSDP